MWLEGCTYPDAQSFPRRSTALDLKYHFIEFPVEKQPLYRVFDRDGKSKGNCPPKLILHLPSKGLSETRDSPVNVPSRVHLRRNGQLTGVVDLAAPTWRRILTSVLS